MMRLWCIISLCWLLNGAIAGQTITLSVQNRPLKEVLAELQRQAGYSFVPVGDAGERTVTLMLDKASLFEAVRRLRQQTGYSFLLSGKTYFVVPSLTANELWKRLTSSAPSSPSRFGGTLSLTERTPWGWQKTTTYIRFQSPDRFVAEMPTALFWSDGQRTWLWDKQQSVMIEQPSPLWDWAGASLGVSAVPAFGHGWTNLEDWQPTDTAVSLVAGRPTWVLELTRKGKPPTQVTFLFTRVSLPGTIYAPYHEPQPIAWRVRCYLDCETLTVIRREVYDPRGLSVRVVTATALERQGNLIVPRRFEVLDAGLTVVAKGDWSPQELTGDFAAPTPPADVLTSETPVGRLLTQARRSWLDRDDAATAIRLLEQALQQTDHPAALLDAATLYAQMNRPEKAWACLEKMSEKIWQFPDAVSLAMTLADTLRAWTSLEEWLRKQADRPSPAVWMALAQLSALRAWQQDKESSEPLEWYGRILKHLTQKSADSQSLIPGSLPLAWDAAQRLFEAAWRFGRLKEVKAIAQSLLTKPTEPIGIALLAWLAMEEDDEAQARQKLRQLRERYPDWTALRLTMAELAEAYGLSDEAEEEYRAMVNEMPMLPEGNRARTHLLRRLVETDRAEDAVRFFLDSFASFRSDWTKDGWVSEFREVATSSLRHNRIANLADWWWKKRIAHPYAMWLFDLMAHFADSEGKPDEALNILHQATIAYPKSGFYAARWCQGVIRLHDIAMRLRSQTKETFSPEEISWLKEAPKQLAMMDKRLLMWQAQFSAQPFFGLLFIFTPNLQSAYEENPAVLRRLAREAVLRAHEWRKRQPMSAPEGLLVNALALLNHAGNWLDRPDEVRTALLQLEQVDGEQWHGLRHLARQLFIAFNGFQPNLSQLLPLIDRGMAGCRDDTERIVIAQNAVQVLVQRGQWDEALSRLHTWLSLPGSDLYRRSLLLGWRVILTPLLSDEKMRPIVQERLKTLPDDAVGWVLQAEAFEAMGGTDKAKETYQKALSHLKAPLGSAGASLSQVYADWLWQLYGEAALRWGDLATAEKALMEAVRQAPTWERALMWLQTRSQQEKPPDAETIRRWLVHFGWRWQLLTALSAQSEPPAAFRLLRLSERLATVDPTVAREQLFALRLNLARTAIAVGQTQLARFWLDLLRQPEAPEDFQTVAGELLQQLPP